MLAGPRLEGDRGSDGRYYIASTDDSSVIGVTHRGTSRPIAHFSSDGKGGPAVGDLQRGFVTVGGDPKALEITFQTRIKREPNGLILSLTLCRASAELMLLPELHEYRCRRDHATTYTTSKRKCGLKAPANGVWTQRTGAARMRHELRPHRVCPTDRASASQGV
jgi:hypothetical protein